MGGPVAKPEAERFWASVDFDGEGGCWLWTQKLAPSGYGQFGVGRRAIGTYGKKRAHRWAYEHLVGPIPEGLVLDHLCRVRHCVNPDHMEPVTSRENTLRGETRPAINAARTHCTNGHEFTPENTGTTHRGGRRCRACAREWQRRHHGKRPGLRRVP